MSLLSKLPQLPFLGQKEADQEYFFALNIDAALLSGAVWTVEHKQLRILSTSQLQYESKEDLAEAANQLLDEVLGDLPFEPKKVLFGVPDFWLQDDNLKEEYSQILQQLVKDIDLEPLAYVSSNYAIAYLLHKQTGVPLTAILANVGERLVVTVVKAGKIVGTKNLKRSQNLPQDIEKALSSLTDIEVLPSRLLLYGPDHLTSKMEKFKDELQGFNWMSTLPFLHLPKIEILAEGIEILAVCFAGGAEFAPDLKVTSHALPEKITSTSPVHRKLGEKSLKDLGFVAGDVSQKSLPPTKEEEEEEIEENYFEDKESRGTLPPPTLGLTKTFNQVVNRFSQIIPAGLGTAGSRQGQNLMSPRLLIPVVLFILFLIAGFIFLPKAKVTVYVDPKVLENEAEVVADPSVTAVDEAAKKIPAKVVETDVSGSGRAPTTGKKQIGESAKGKVALYNKTNAAKNFDQGTVLLATGGLAYKLDTSVQVASQSAGTEGVSYGKSIVAVTAQEIGPESNLAAGKDLTVKGESANSFSARVDSDISGGTSKEVAVVTSDDQKKLLASVTSDLRRSAQSQLQAKLTEGEKILEEALVEGTIKPQYSKAVGDQSSDLSLTLQVKYKGTAYNENDLKTIVAKLVQTTVPDGFMLNLQDAETQSDVVKVEKDNRLIFKAKFKAKLMPQIDKEKIIAQIKGKTPSQVAEIVRQHESVIGSQVDIKPSLPAFLQRMPMIERNIQIDVTTK